MASLQATMTGSYVRQGSGRPGRRVDGVLLAVLIAAVFAALSSIYFGVNAGADYPETWAQMSD